MTTKEVLEKINDNEELAKKLLASKKPEKAYEILKAEGLTDSFEEFKSAAVNLNETNSKLSEDELDDIFGGGTGDVGTGFCASALAAGSAAGFAL